MARNYNRLDAKREKERILEDVQNQFWQDLEEMRQLEEDIMGDFD